MKTLLQWLADCWLEYRIGMRYHLWMLSDWKDRNHMEKLNALLRKRSARRIAKMERAKGLA